MNIHQRKIVSVAAGLVLAALSYLPEQDPTGRIDFDWFFRLNYTLDLPTLLLELALLVLLAVIAYVFVGAGAR